MGIACKKIVSSNNIEKQISKGVKQIEINNFDFGIVAINIDNLTPEKSILKIDVLSDALDFLHKINMNFIEENERHFLKYLKDSRIIAVIIHSSVIADISLNKPQFNNLSQTTMWSIKNLDSRLKNKIDQFRVLES